VSKAHSLSGDGRERDLSGHGKELTEQGTLTAWRWQREGIVKTRKETEQAVHSHTGDSRGTCQDTERNRASKAHSPTGDSRGKDLSGHGKKQTERGSLTSWRQQREGLVRTRKGTDLARGMGTHILEMQREGQVGIRDSV
jgi:hypothetical protein